MTDFDRLSDEAQRAVEQGRLHTARQLYERCLERFPEHTLFLGFNLGAMLHMQAGDGSGARQAYDQALAGRARSEGTIRKGGLDELEASVCENSMLLSLSYEEYESRAERLAGLDPVNPILSDQRPMVRDSRERGHPWFAVMLTIAKSGYDADPSKDPGRYGASASIMQLLLENRRELRVPGDQYRIAVGSYAALVVQAWSKCGMTMEQALGEADPEELDFVVETAIPLVRRYVDVHPSDPQIEEALRMLESALVEAPGRGSSASARPDTASATSTQADRPVGCAWMPAGAVLGGIAGHLLLPDYPEATAIGVGATLGAIGALAVLATFHRGRGRARPEANGVREAAATGNGSVRSSSPVPRLPKHPDHYESTRRSVGGAHCRLTLVQTGTEGPFVRLVYRWDEDLGHEQADKVDSRARAFISCAIYDAAIQAGLSCRSAPAHGQRPAWHVEGETIPISLVGAGFDASGKLCYMDIGPIAGMPGTTGGSGALGANLLRGFESSFGQITV